MLLDKNWSEKFTVQRDLKLGNPLSTTLFNLVMERKAFKSLEGKIREYGLTINDNKTKYMSTESL